jgi:hypothetical protein
VIFARFAGLPFQLVILILFLLPFAAMGRSSFGTGTCMRGTTYQETEAMTLAAELT